ncbi:MULTISPECIES: hypothetical protein [Spirulina sp. CCY15215]|uniref:hypothetical protein n=1 Tax=Spirulina sp. CCY15215 TaxID=2767591 RepID=UPI001950BF4C|nr:hypothetical protein [Spirulina major]
MLQIKSLLKTLFSTAIAVSFLHAGATLAETIAIRPQSGYNKTLNGLSGGNVNTNDCGFISNSPNHVITLDTDIDSMEIKINVAGGEPTLLIEGPDGRFCTRAINGEANITGYWPAGEYTIIVGDRLGANSQFNYTLSIRQ